MRERGRAPALAVLATVLSTIGACTPPVSLSSEDLPGLLVRYEDAINRLALAVKGAPTCADKGKAIEPLLTELKPWLTKVRIASQDEKLRVELTRLVDARGKNISDAEILFNQTRTECKDDATYRAQIDRMNGF